MQYIYNNYSLLFFFVERMWHVERMDDYRMARRVLMAEVSGGMGARETEVRLDGRWR